MKNIDVELSNISEIKQEYDYFKCTNGSLNRYLAEDAYYHDLMSLAKTKLVKIAVSKSEERTVGFFTLQLKKFTIQEDGDKEEYPCIYLKCIATDKNYEGRGIGTNVLNYIISQSKNFSDFVGCRCLLIDALTEDINWYRDRGFQFVDEDNVDDDILEPTIEMFIDFRNKSKVDNYFDE